VCRGLELRPNNEEKENHSHSHSNSDSGLRWAKNKNQLCQQAKIPAVEVKKGRNLRMPNKIKTKFLADFTKWPKFTLTGTVFYEGLQPQFTF
jgi:hypothetical protein